MKPCDPITQQALDYFSGEYNCAQSVLMTFADKYQLDITKAKGISAAFGAGMGHLQETCGAVTGAFMVLGLHASRLNLSYRQRKELIISKVQRYTALFTEEFGSTLCRDLIGVDLNTADGAQKASEENLYQKKCTTYITRSIQILEDIL